MYIVCVFHDRMVDRNIAGLLPYLAGKAVEPQIGLCARDGGAHGVQQIGAVRFERGDQGGGREQEDARVPQVVAGFQHLLRPRGIGFLDKAADG